MSLLVYSMIYKEYHFLIRRGTGECRMVIRGLSIGITCTIGIHGQVLIDTLEHSFNINFDWHLGESCLSFADMQLSFN